MIVKKEGSRGGHIIGHTKSGAPVYAGTASAVAAGSAIAAKTLATKSVAASKLSVKALALANKKTHLANTVGQHAFYKNNRASFVVQPMFRRQAKSAFSHAIKFGAKAKKLGSLSRSAKTLAIGSAVVGGALIASSLLKGKKNAK